MKKRKLKPCIKTTLKVIAVVLVSFILTIALLIGMVENHHHLLETKYAPQNKKVSKTAPQLEKDTYLHYTMKGV